MASEGAAKMYRHVRLCCWKNLYVVTLKSFNRIFDYSLARTDIARTAARCRAVMRLSADGVRFRSASEPVRASLVFFYASLGSEIDNAITLLHAAPTRPAPMSA